MTVSGQGRLIVLNGGSSAGKTSLAQAFQNVAAECWMHLGIDVFWLALPPEQLDLARVRPEYYSWDSVVEDDGLPWFTVHPGGDRHPGWARGSARAAHADAEYDVEVDTTATPVSVLARRLYERYRSGPEPVAFDRLRMRFLS